MQCSETGDCVSSSGRAQIHQIWTTANMPHLALAAVHIGGSARGYRRRIGDAARSVLCTVVQPPRWEGPPCLSATWTSWDGEGLPYDAADRFSLVARSQAWSREGCWRIAACSSGMMLFSPADRVPPDTGSGRGPHRSCPLLSAVGSASPRRLARLRRPASSPSVPRFRSHLKRVAADFARSRTLVPPGAGNVTSPVTGRRLKPDRAPTRAAG
jgi:hypothetical protein